VSTRIGFERWQVFDSSGVRFEAQATDQKWLMMAVLASGYEPNEYVISFKIYWMIMNDNL
jgi:hypothetical protein